MPERAAGKLGGQTAVVTGAASGIGRAVAVLFTREGAHVAAVDRDAAMLGDLAKHVAADGGDCSVYPGDVGDASAVKGVADAVLALRNAVDILVTCAGVPADGTVVEADEAAWDEAFAVNAKGTYLWMRAVLPSMLASRRGSIVTVASQLAVSGGRGNAVYCASKGAVISLTKAAAVDHAEQGVRINVILPGAIRTPMLEASFERAPEPAKARERSLLRHPMRRFGAPEDVARAALYLASDDSGFTTGAELAVDGGWLAG